MYCSLHCHVAHISNLLFLQLPCDHSTRAVSFSPHFLLHSPLHTLRKFPFSPAASSEPESLYLDIQRVTNRRSNPVLRQISAVVKPSLCKKTTAPRSSAGLRDMRFFRKNREKIQFPTKTQNLESGACCGVNIFLFAKNQAGPGRFHRNNKLGSRFVSLLVSNHSSKNVPLILCHSLSRYT